MIELSKRDAAYGALANQVMEKLRSGKIAWRRKWNVLPPHSYSSGLRYSGANFLNLFGEGTSPYWITPAGIMRAMKFSEFKQVYSSLKEGSQAKIVIFWKTFPVDEVQTRNGVEVVVTKQVPFLRYYRVYNAGDVEGLPKKKLDAVNYTQKEKIAKCEEIIDKAHPSIKFNGNQPKYIPKLDVIETPTIASFEDSESYYATFFHEMGHWTGHEKRLSRIGITEASRGDIPKYSFEELIAEMTSAFLCAEAQISNEEIMDNAAEYIAGWLSRIEENPKWIVQAASAAQKATNFILESGKEKEPDENVEDGAIK